MVCRAGQRKGHVRHSNLHFLGAPVPLPHMCQMSASQVSQPAQQTQVVSRGQQQPRGPQTPYIVVDDQQTETLRQLHFTIRPTKVFNPPTVASVKAKKVHTTSQDSSIFRNLESVMSYPQNDTPQALTPSDPHEHRRLTSNHPVARASSAASKAPKQS